MAAKTLSVYLKVDGLYEKVKAKHDDPKDPFDYREICSQALERVINGEPEPQPASAEAIEEMARIASQIPDEPGTSDVIYEFEIQTYNTATEAQNFLLLLADPEGGGYPISMSIDPIGRYVFLVGWPKAAPVPG